MGLTTDETELLRRAIALSSSARQHGNHPFGALLADPDGAVLLEAENTVVTESDVTGHAETNLVRRASRALGPESMTGATMFTSTEPCAMCSGAVYWSSIERVVYAMSEADLLKMTGDHDENPTLSLGCRAVFDAGQRQIDVTGPALPDEAMAVHAGFWRP